MLDQSLQHIDITLGTDATIDTDVNTRADIKSSIHKTIEYRPVYAAGSEFPILILLAKEISFRLKG
jgi:hypothetical protein